MGRRENDLFRYLVNGSLLKYLSQDRKKISKYSRSRRARLNLSVFLLHKNHSENGKSES